MADDLAAHEREKYERVWEHAAYRSFSPGMQEVEPAWAAMGCRPGESLNDYGCGTGRATKWFEDKGLYVIGVDHVRAAVEVTVFVWALNLWDMREVMISDYAFCCDVMEHIPPEKVDAVLANIARLTRKAGWFRIATRPDVFGPMLIGEPLHLTVQPARWWHLALSQHFAHVERRQDSYGYAVFLVRP